ncbi:hypothetical protein AGR1C_Cc40264 [Agrobacterium fabacearum TT111]|nr:hypothetical protein AGR1C_Cc40264 [Agrobacterium fabacearum TT111]
MNIAVFIWWHARRSFFRHVQLGKRCFVIEPNFRRIGYREILEVESKWVYSMEFWVMVQPWTRENLKNV